MKPLRAGELAAALAAMPPEALVRVDCGALELWLTKVDLIEDENYPPEVLIQAEEV